MSTHRGHYPRVLIVIGLSAAAIGTGNADQRCASELTSGLADAYVSVAAVELNDPRRGGAQFSLWISGFGGLARLQALATVS